MAWLKPDDVAALEILERSHREGRCLKPGSIEFDGAGLVIVCHRSEDISGAGLVVGLVARSRLLVQGLNLPQVGGVAQHVDGATSAPPMKIWVGIGVKRTRARSGL